MTWELVLALQIVHKFHKNYCPHLHLSIGQVWQLNELLFKRYIQKCTLSCTNTHDDITDAENYGIV